MPKFRQILYNSLVSTGRFPRWWILAFIQILAFFIVGEMGRPHWLNPVSVFYLVCSGLLLGPISSWLWLDIESSNLKSPKKLPVKTFFIICFTTALIVVSSILLVLFVRIIFKEWIFLAMTSSLISATAFLAMLYAVLCYQPFFKSLALALDTWNKKISLAASTAFILIVGHAASFAAVHGLFGNVKHMGGFSVFNHSATIWLLLACLGFLASVIAAFLNCFLVLLFLDTIKPEKHQEQVKVLITKLDTIEAAN